MPAVRKPDVKESLHREMRVNAIVFNDANRTFELSFSSEEEYEQWPGVMEILSHDADAVDLGRLNGGANLLFNHDYDDYVGVVESASIGLDRKGRAVVRCGESDFAKQIEADVKAGILRNVSVGYRIKAWEESQREGGLMVVKVTKWEPYEISIVTVPADATVGIGRSAKPNLSKQENHMNRDQIIAALKKRGLTVPADATDEKLLELLGTREAVDVTTERAGAANGERSRVTAIQATAKKFAGFITTEETERAISEGASEENFSKIILEKVHAREKALKQSGNLGLTQVEAKRFSFMKLLRALANPQDKASRDGAGYEFEVCEAAAATSHRSAKGMMIPLDVLRAFADPEFVKQRAGVISIGSGVGLTGTAAALQSNTLRASSFIELYQAASILIPRATPLTGLVGTFDIPRQTSEPTSGWIGEDGAAPQTSADFGLISMAPKTVSAWVELTRRSLMNSEIDVENWIRSRMAARMALEVDKKGFYGDGTNGTPKGIKNTDGIGAVDFASNAAPTFAELVAMETKLAVDNVPLSSIAYFGNPAFRGYAKTTRKLSTSTDSQTLWEPGNTINGYEAVISTQITGSDVFFQNSKDLLYGEWGGLDVVVDPYSNSTRGRVRIVMMKDVDWLVSRPESFVVGV